MLQSEIDEMILDVAEAHPEYNTGQFISEFKLTFERDPTLQEKRSFQKAVKNIKTKPFEGYAPLFNPPPKKDPSGEVLNKDMHREEEKKQEEIIDEEERRKKAEEDERRKKEKLEQGAAFVREMLQKQQQEKADREQQRKREEEETLKKLKAVQEEERRRKAEDEERRKKAKLEQGAAFAKQMMLKQQQEKTDTKLQKKDSRKEPAWTIIVKDLVDDQYTFEVQGTDTVNSLKAKIEGKTKVRAAQQRLLLGNTELMDNDRTLASYEMDDGSVLYLVISVDGDWGGILVRDLMDVEYAIHDIQPTDTVDALKREIEHQSGIPFISQRLLFGNTELADGKKTLQDYELESLSIVYLFLD